MLTSAIRDRAEARFGDSSNAIYTAQEWLDYVNERYHEVWGAHPDWPFKQSHATVTLTAGSRVGALAAGTWKVLTVRDATNDNVLMPLVRNTDLVSLSPNDDDSGSPSLYRLFGTSIEVWPKPEANVTLDVDTLIQSVDLAAGDTPAFPAQYHLMLVDGALASAYLDDGNMELYQLYEGKFQVKLQQMQHDLLGSRDEGYQVITDNWWG